MNLDIEIGSNALKELSERMKWKADAFSADEVFADSIANPSDEEERSLQRPLKRSANRWDCRSNSNSSLTTNSGARHWMGRSRNE